VINLYEEDLPERDILTGKPTGALKAAGMGLMKGGVNIAKAATILGYSHGGNTEGSREMIWNFYEDYIKPAEKYWSIDPETTSQAGQIFHGIAQIGIPLMFGPAAMPVLIGETTINTAADLIDQGVDEKTARKGAMLAGLATAAMVKIPAAGKTLARTLGLVAANPIIGAGQTEITRQLLESEGFTEQAKQYDPLDPVGRSVDVVMGLASGMMHHAGIRKAKKAFEKGKAGMVTNLDTVLNNAEYNDYLKTLPIEAEDALNIIRQHQQKIRQTPFDTKAPAQMRQHLDAMNKALADLTEDRLVDVTKEARPVIEIQPPPRRAQGDPYATPAELIADLKALRGQQAEMRTLLKSGYDLAREAEKQGLTGPEMKARAEETILSAGEKIRPLEEYVGSEDFTAWQKAVSEGRTIQRQTEPFNKWFGQSKVVDENGEPLVVYHGTVYGKDIEKIGQFDSSKLGTNTNAQSSKEAFFFAADPLSAEGYANKDYNKPQELKEAEDAWIKSLEEGGGITGDVEIAKKLVSLEEEHKSRGSSIIPVFLKMDNPLVHDQRNQIPRDESYVDLIKKAKENGHDGVIIKNTFDSPISDTIYAVFSPTQIRFKFATEHPDSVAAQEMVKAEVTRADADIKAETDLNEIPEFRHELVDFDTQEPVEMAGPNELTAQYYDANGKPLETIEQRRERLLKKGAKGKGIEDWIKTKGGVNYAKEALKGELDALKENGSRVLLKKDGKGRTLDQLALMAKEEGWIKEATPEALLRAIEEKAAHPSAIEDQISARMEAEARTRDSGLGTGKDKPSPSEAFVEDFLAGAGDEIQIPATFIDANGREVKGTLKDMVENAKLEMEAVNAHKDTFERISKCIRQGG